MGATAAFFRILVAISFPSLVVEVVHQCTACGHENVHRGKLSSIGEHVQQEKMGFRLHTVATFVTKMGRRAFCQQ